MIFNPLAIFGRHSKEDPTVALTAEVILGEQKPLANISTSPESGALFCSAVFSAERFICEALASLPLVTYNRATKEKADGHPAYAILKQRPNDFQNYFIFWSTAWRRGIRSGNGFVFCEQDEAGRLANLLLLENARVTVNMVNGSKVYTYKGDQEYTIPAGRMIHLMGYTEDGIIGMPLLKYGEKAVGLSLLTEDYGLKFFTDGEAPSGRYCKVPFSDKNKITAVKAAIQLWRSNRHQIPIIPEGGELAGDATDNQASQFLELRQFQVQEVARFMRVPPSIIWHYQNGGTYSNLQAEQLALVSNCLQCWISQWEQEVTRAVFTAAGDFYAEAELSARLRGDLLQQMQAWEIGQRIGAYCPDDIRRMLNLPPLPDGKGKVFSLPTYTAPMQPNNTPKGNADASQQTTG